MEWVTMSIYYYIIITKTVGVNIFQYTNNLKAVTSKHVGFLYWNHRTFSHYRPFKFENFENNPIVKLSSFILEYAPLTVVITVDTWWLTAHTRTHATSGWTDQRGR